MSVDDIRQQQKDWTSGYNLGAHDAEQHIAREERSIPEKIMDSVIFDHTDNLIGGIIDAIIPTPEPSEGFKEGYEQGFQDEYRKHHGE